jgi:hypothetical protein
LTISARAYGDSDSTEIDARSGQLYRMARRRDGRYSVDVLVKRWVVPHRNVEDVFHDMVKEIAVDRLRLLREVSFGAQVAEEETGELAEYFVETDQWLRIFGGEVDVIRGHKGAGKSAIYLLLSTRTDELFDKGILLISAEKPRGTPVFKDLVIEPPASEAEFIGLWKLYIVVLIAQRMKEFEIKGTSADQLYMSLGDQGLLDSKADLTRIFRIVKEYAKRWFNQKAIETELKFDSQTGLPTGLVGKITPGEPSSELREKGFVSVDRLLELANVALQSVELHVWVLMDRLDVAFAETHQLERNALRALFRVYLDLAGHDWIKLKIFLRSDIWTRIVEGGFREASHITRVVALEWTPEALLNLVIRRLLKNTQESQFLFTKPSGKLACFACPAARR